MTKKDSVSFNETQKLEPCTRENIACEKVRLVRCSQIDSVSSRMAPNGTQVQNVSVKVRAILKSGLLAASCQMVKPHLRSKLSDIGVIASKPG